MSEDTYRPYILNQAQLVEIINARTKRLEVKIYHLTALGENAGRECRELTQLSWLKEALPSMNGVAFTYNEFLQFVGDSREP